MRGEQKHSWARDIHRQVYELVLILAMLVVVAAGYHLWSHVSVETVRNNINDHHLVASSQYLRAMQELRNMQAHQVEPREKRSNEGSRWDQGFTQANNQQSVNYHLAEEAINKGLVLERHFDDPQFRELGDKLEQQALELAELYNIDGTGSIEKAQPGNIIEKLLVSLEQATRLHSITREDKLDRLHARERFQDNIYYGSMVLLLLIAALVARSSFSSIKRIIKTQIGAEKKIEHQAHYDHLTNLPNRFLATDRLEQMMSDAQRNDTRVAVLLIDLDNFKKVNDMLGQTNADRLLVEYAKRIRLCVRAGDTVGRLGGDEFVVLSGGISNTNDVKVIAQQLIDQINEEFALDDKELVLTASIGISVYPDDGKDCLELLRKADSAMYHSKGSGRNTYSYFDESMSRKASRLLALEEQLPGALDRGEFSLVYQQKVDLADNRIIGAEALLRWNNATLGEVSPVEFIPVAEQTGLIVPMGHFVLTEALRMTREWRDTLAADFNIAVNLSPRQFRDPDLVNTISRLLHEAGLPSTALELEITEGVLLNDYIHIDQALDDLKKLGVELVMDDFGTGYSSMSYLRQYPFGVIKIDRSFIQDIDSNPMSLKLNHAVIAMAHALNIRVVAEGIETHTQHSLLQELECDVAQGYYFGRPVPALKMGEVLRAQQRQATATTVVDITESKGHIAKLPQSNES